MFLFSRCTAFLIVPFMCIAWQQNPSQQKADAKPVATATAVEASNAEGEGKNPVKPTPENLAKAKKIFGYDCAMCHGATADGKGDLAASMGLKMEDWQDSHKFASLSEGEIFHLIVKGKGRMIGEGNRYPTDMVWNLVNYVRTFAKKEPASGPSR